MPLSDTDLLIALLAAPCLGIASGLVVYLLYRYKEKKRFIKAERAKNLLKIKLEIQEETFEHISNEIHDNINLSLTLAKLQLVTLKTDDPELLQTTIGSTVDLLSGSILDLSRLSKRLDSDFIKRNGLIHAIYNQLERIREASSLTIRFEISGESRFLSPEKELVIYRIIQEGFNNILKHAKAKNAILAINYRKQEVFLVLTDDGTGFLHHTGKRSPGLGLANIKNRALVMQGKAEIVSATGKGTQVQLLIPYHDK